MSLERSPSGDNTIWLPPETVQQYSVLRNGIQGIMRGGEPYTGRETELAGRLDSQLGNCIAKWGEWQEAVIRSPRRRVNQRTVYKYERSRYGQTPPLFFGDKMATYNVSIARTPTEYSELGVHPQVITVAHGPSITEADVYLVNPAACYFLKGEDMLMLGTKQIRMLGKLTDRIERALSTARPVNSADDQEQLRRSPTRTYRQIVTLTVKPGTPYL